MSEKLNDWLLTADEVLLDPHVHDDTVDALIHIGLGIQRVPDETVDQVRLERVLAVLRARHAAMASELNDLGRRRAELRRAQVGASGYLNPSARVPMH